MAHVVVTIAGRTYRMACEDGEEQRLDELAKLVETKILSLREGFGEIGEQRITVMAALTLADEAWTATSKLEAAQAEAAALREQLAASREAEAALEEKIAAALEDATTRVERLSRELQSSGGDETPLTL
jgi:cell division protein ZapA